MAAAIIVFVILGAAVGGVCYCLGYLFGTKWAVKTFWLILSEKPDDPPTEEEKPWGI